MTPEHLPLPEAFVKRMEKMLGVEAPAFFASYERPARRALRFDPAKVAAGEQARLLEAMGIEAEPVPWAADAWYYPEDATPGKHPFHTLGLYYIQEASAMLPATLLEVEPGERVLDLCAAPGGKTTQLAAALRGRGLLLANEVHPARAKVLSQNVERWGSAGVVVTREEPARLAARFPAFFDKVLVDAPCSGEGMFRKDEQARGEWSEEAVRRCAARQQNILESAAAMVAPGGLLCYSTCTFSEEENEETVAAFLSRHRDFRQIDLRKRLGPASAGIVVGRDGKSLRIFPHLAEGEGHFAALMQRDGTPLMRDRMDRIEKKKKGKDPALERALDLWNDFRKVVDFIDINREWLTERMQVIALKPYRYTMESLR